MLRTGLCVGILLLPLWLMGCGDRDGSANKQPPLAEQAAPALSNYTITSGSAGYGATRDAFA